jgi:toxin YoeB
MLISFQQDAFDDFTDWSIVHKLTYKKILTLIKEIKRTPFEGTGKPEPLKYQFSGYWSRRITAEHRLVYKVTENEIIIISCKGHY